MIIFIIQKCRKVNYFVGKKETHHYIQIKTKFWNTLKTPLLVKVRFCAFPVLKGVQKKYGRTKWGKTLPKLYCR